MICFKKVNSSTEDKYVDALRKIANYNASLDYAPWEDYNAQDVVDALQSLAQSILKEEKNQMSEMIAFPSIESFRHVIKNVERHCNQNNLSLPTIDYVGRGKLHGTSASLRFTNGQIIPQSRSRTLAVGDDNYGFASFVNNNQESFQKIYNLLVNEVFGEDGDYTVYGEWVGKGIQDKVALSQLDRHFVIFSVLDHSKPERMIPWSRSFVRFSSDVDEFNGNGVYFITQIPEYTISIDFSRPEDFVDQLSEWTLAVEKECPWGKFMGVSGVGEGLVLHSANPDLPFDLWFKVKGLEHKKGGGKAKVEIAPEITQNLRDLAEIMLPEWRLEQGLAFLRESNLELDPKNIGKYLQWISSDVMKENSDILAANNVEWKQVTSYVLTRARQFILNKIEKDI